MTRDLIDRADALAAIALGDTVSQLQAKILAIPAAAIPARGVGVPTEAQFMDAVWAALKADATDLGKQQRILAAFRAALSTTDYTLAPHLQKIVDGAKTAPQWDMQADRLAPTDAAQAREDVDIVEWLRAGPDDVSISFTLQGPNGMLSVQYEKPRVAAELVEEWRRSK